MKYALILLNAAVAVASLGGCSHVSGGSGSPLFNEDRYRSKAQVVRLSDCDKLESLRKFEVGLFQMGFVRTMVRDEGVIPYELIDGLVSGEHKLIEFTKSDFTPVKERGSVPYREVRNRYKITACEEPGGALYLMIVRHDPEPGDQFLGARLNGALQSSGCLTSAVAPPREIGFYQGSTEDDIIRHVQRGRCQDYATGR